VEAERGIVVIVRAGVERSGVGTLAVALLEYDDDDDDDDDDDMTVMIVRD
jgi:hypothetical protein